MTAALAPWMALALVFAGFTALALAMERHHRQVWQRAAPARRRVLLRIAGAASLVASLAACVAGHGWGTGIVLWTGLLSAGALAVAMVLSYRPQFRQEINPSHFQQDNGV